MRMRSMPSARVVPMVFLLVGLMMPSGELCAEDAADAESAAKRESPSVHLRVRELASESGGRAFLNIEFGSATGAVFPVPFNAQVLAPKDLGTIEAVFQIADLEGRRLVDTSIKTSAPAGSTPLRFLWEGSDLPDGDYLGSIEVFQTGTKALARRTFVATKRSADRVEEIFQKATEVLAEFKEHGGSEAPPRYVEGRLAIAEEALSRAAALRGDLFTTHDAAAYALETVRELRAQWAFGAHPALEASSVEGLAIVEGGLRAEGGPLFLGGLAIDADSAQVRRVAEYRLNFATVYVASGDRSSLREIADAAGERNVALLTLISGDDVRADDLEALRDDFGDSRTQLAVGLAAPPAIDLTEPLVLEGFVRQVKRTYKDRYELNRMWRKRFKNFDEIEIWPDYDRRSYQYDWQTYHMALATSKTLDLLARYRGADSSVALTVALDDGLIRLGETRRGIDHEALAPALELGLLETYVSYPDPVFGMQYPEQSMLQALRRSFAPDAPLIVVQRIDTRDPNAWYGRDLARDVQASVWESAIEGAAGFVLDFRKAADLGEISGAAEFEAIEGLLVATLDINRSVTVLEAFRQERPTVAILWSDSSRILDDGTDHLASLQRAYEGTSFAGHKVRFLTERQLARGEWEGISLLIVPQTPALSRAAFVALQELIDTGIAIIRSATSIPYGSRGAAQQDVLVFGPNTVLARGADVSIEYMEAMDEAISRGRIPNIPRVINRSGYPVEGVKTRYVEVDGQGYLYVINLRKEEITCTLSGGDMTGWDMIRDRAVDFPRVLEPLRPMLIRMGSDRSHPNVTDS